MNVSSETTRIVQQRAAGRCEYCRMHQALQGATFHVEHVVPRSQGGSSAADNLAWACPGCNLRKSDRTIALDSVSGKSVLLFNPRQEQWHDHFAFQGFEIAGKSDTGRATLALLELNHARRVQIRQAESLFGLFPP